MPFRFAIKSSILKAGEEKKNPITISTVTDYAL
jgi:hypothetical protein